MFKAILYNNQEERINALKQMFARSQNRREQAIAELKDMESQRIAI